MSGYNFYPINCIIQDKKISDKTKEKALKLEDMICAEN